MMDCGMGGAGPLELLTGPEEFSFLFLSGRVQSGGGWQAQHVLHVFIVSLEGTAKKPSCMSWYCFLAVFQW